MAQQEFKEGSMTVSESVGDVEICLEHNCACSGDKYAFLTKERAAELRDWLNTYLANSK